MKNENIATRQPIEAITIKSQNFKQNSPLGELLKPYRSIFNSPSFA